MKVKVTDSLDNVPNENVVTQLVIDRQSDQLLELLELLFATKKLLCRDITPGERKVTQGRTL